MQLPEFIVAYSKALLSAPWRFTLVYLSAFSNTSHDVLTRGLQKKYSFKQLLRMLLSNKLLSTGYIILDETDVDKSFAKHMQGLSWIFSHRKNKYIFGLHIVVMVWTNETITLPLAWKIYSKQSGKTKIDLAMELIDYCLNKLKIVPKAFLFDSFYAAEPVLKQLIKKHQYFYSQLPKGRLFNKKALREVNKGRPYWQEVGVIKGSIKVQVVRNRRKYYVTNAIGITRKEQLATYKIRWKIEEVFRFVKQELGFERCHVQSLRGQNNHFGTCFYIYGKLQDIAEKTQMTDYAIKLKATQDRSFVNQLGLATLLTGA
jgi:putative transposase